MENPEFYARYDDAHDTKYKEPFEVPLVRATSETLEGFGRMVTSFEEEDVIITPWPVTGTRKLCVGTGVGAGLREDENISNWEGDMCINTNKAVGETVPVGRLAKGETKDNRRHVLVRAVNYHPDGGQVFFPKEKTAFIALLGKLGDDVKLEDFRAFYFDGSCGFQVFPYVWHQALYPLGDTATVIGKQGAVFACVYCHFTEEFGRFVSVPLTNLDSQAK